MALIFTRCFKDMKNLYHLGLRKNQIQSIMPYILTESNKLRIIDLSANYISSLGPNIFNGPSKLSLLNITKNPLLQISLDAFTNFEIRSIDTKSYKVCCIKPSEATVCEASPPWPNSCERLLAESSIRVLMLVISSVGFVLNVIVCCHYAIRDRARRFHKSSENRKVNKPRLCYNITVMFIAFGDALYSISLMFIVLSDVFHGDQYLEREHIWRLSVLCFMTSVLALASMKISCIAINTMAYLRLYLITKPLSATLIEVRHVASRLIMTSSASLIFSFILILIYRLTSETRQLPTGLCLMLGNIDQSVIPKIITFITLSFQAGSSFLVSLMYSIMYHTLQKQQQSLRSMFGGEVKHRATSKALLVSLTNLICWIPSSIILILTLTWNQYPYKLLVWMTALVLPLNSIINPFVFVYSKTISKWVKRWHPFR